MHQIIKQTDDEKRKMYNKIKKDKLITMLIEANKIINRITILDEFGKKLQENIIDIPSEFVDIIDKNFKYLTTYGDEKGE